MLLPISAAAVSVYETQSDFLTRAFGTSLPEPGVIWLSGETKSSVGKILGHPYAGLRVRYWCRAAQSAWILEEIGKEQPITVGIIINSNYIKSLGVLTYRENRGGEVATPAFTDQFMGASINASGRLSKKIDSISGATLSVNALTRLANMALFLHDESGCADGA
jgi:hypothetical protein